MDAVVPDVVAAASSSSNSSRASIQREVGGCLRPARTRSNMCRIGWIGAMDVEEFEFDDLPSRVDPDLGHLCEGAHTLLEARRRREPLDADDPDIEPRSPTGEALQPDVEGLTDLETEMVHDVFVRDSLDVGTKRCMALEEAVEQIIGTLSTQMPGRRDRDGAVERDGVEYGGLGVNPFAIEHVRVPAAPMRQSVGCVHLRS